MATSKYSWPWLKVGDKVKLKDYSKYEFPEVRDQIAVISRIDSLGVHCIWPNSKNINFSTLSVDKAKDGGYLFGAYLVDDEGNPLGERKPVKAKSLGNWEL